MQATLVIGDDGYLVELVNLAWLQVLELFSHHALVPAAGMRTAGVVAELWNQLVRRVALWAGGSCTRGKAADVGAVDVGSVAGYCAIGV